MTADTSVESLMAEIADLRLEIGAYKESTRQLAERVEKAEADNAALRAMMPSEEEREAIDHCTQWLPPMTICTVVRGYLARLSPPSAPARDGAHRAIVHLPPPVACACFQPPGSWCKTLGAYCADFSAPAQDGAEWLDLSTPDAVIEAELRGMGLDPEALAARGAALAQKARCQTCHGTVLEWRRCECADPGCTRMIPFRCSTCGGKT